MGRMVGSLAAEYGFEVAGIMDGRSASGPDGPASSRWKDVDGAIDVSAPRAGHIPGSHEVGFDGPAETIVFSHVARDRSTFARGALVAARWIKGRKGWFTMRDVLGMNTEGVQGMSGR